MTDNHTSREGSPPEDARASVPPGSGGGASTDRRRRGPSVPLLLAGMTALVIAGWALLGPFSLEFLGSVDLRWALVAGAAVAGVVLVVGPKRRSRR